MASVKKVRRTYVEFIFPGAFFVETQIKQIKTRNSAKIEVPRGAFAFYFFDVVKLKTKVGSHTFSKSRKTNVSHRYYYGGKVYTRDEIQQRFPKEQTLLANMVSRKLDKAIKTRCGN